MRALCIAALLAALSSSACAPMSGVPSLSVLGRGALAQSAVPTGEVRKERDCFYWVLTFFLGGNSGPNHEQIIDRMLAEADADVLVDTELTTEQWGLPYVFLMNCATVQGRPAKLAGVAK
jgi:hypothetical protein